MRRLRPLEGSHLFTIAIEPITIEECGCNPQIPNYCKEKNATFAKVAFID